MKSAVRWFSLKVLHTGPLKLALKHCFVILNLHVRLRKSALRTCKAKGRLKQAEADYSSRFPVREEGRKMWGSASLCAPQRFFFLSRSWWRMWRETQRRRGGLSSTRRRGCQRPWADTSTPRWGVKRMHDCISCQVSTRLLSFSLHWSPLPSQMQQRRQELEQVLGIRLT